MRWRRIDLKWVIAERFGVAFHRRYVGKLLQKLGFSHMSARPRHPAQDERIVEAFKRISRARVTCSSRRPAGDDAGRDLVCGRGPDRPEERAGSAVGQARNRPRQPADQRYDNAYLFGAICPARGVGAALALPYADADMMQLHLDEISCNVAEGAHAVLLLDRAGWHTTSKLDVPENITPIFLPSRAPELNPVENVWQVSAPTGSQTPCSKTTTQSSTPHAPLGETSSPSLKRSRPSACETGPTSVTRYDPWYKSSVEVISFALAERRHTCGVAFVIGSRQFHDSHCSRGIKPLVALTTTCVIR